MSHGMTCFHRDLYTPFFLISETIDLMIHNSDAAVLLFTLHHTYYQWDATWIFSQTFMEII